MHSLETIKALNERAVQQCEGCKKYHTEYPGAEVLLAEYVIAATADRDGGFAVEMHRILCPVCANAITETITDFSVRRVDEIGGLA